MILTLILLLLIAAAVGGLVGWFALSRIVGVGIGVAAAVLLGILYFTGVIPNVQLPGANPPVATSASTAVPETTPVATSQASAPTPAQATYPPTPAPASTPAPGGVIPNVQLPGANPPVATPASTAVPKTTPVATSQASAPTPAQATYPPTPAPASTLAPGAPTARPTLGTGMDGMVVVATPNPGFRTPYELVTSQPDAIQAVRVHLGENIWHGQQLDLNYLADLMPNQIYLAHGDVEGQGNCRVWYWFAGKPTTPPLSHATWQLYLVTGPNQQALLDEIAVEQKIAAQGTKEEICPSRKIS